MPTKKRSVRLGDTLLREIADILTRKVKDPRVHGTTLTGIAMSNDLKHARVYYSLIGGEADILKAQAGLDSARGFIKREIGQRMDLRYIPEIFFRHDRSLEEGDHMEKLLQGLKGDIPSERSEE